MVTEITDSPSAGDRRWQLSMSARTTSRKLLVSLLMLVIALWAEAGLALVEGDQAMQCSMSVHEMQAMSDRPCCPGEEMVAPAMSHGRPPCCSVSNAPERPLAVEVISKRVVQQSNAVVQMASSAPLPASQAREAWQSADAPRFIKAVLELKTDLRV